MKDLEGFEEQYPLNSRLVKQDGKLVEEVYRVGGRYDKEIRAIVGTSRRRFRTRPSRWPAALRALIKFYQTGETADRVAYDIAWVAGQGLAGRHDQRLRRGLHGRARHEGIVGGAGLLREPPRRPQGIRKLAADAQWFEDRMPWAPQYRKQGVRGITANAIDVVVETGDSGPITPVGINLPNDQEIREKYGSKSVSLSNVNEAYDKSTSAGVPRASSRGRPRKPRAPRSGAASPAS